MAENRIKPMEPIQPNTTFCLGHISEIKPSEIKININTNKNQLDTTVKSMVKLVYPNVNWEQLSETEKQVYYAQYNDGSLTKKVSEIIEPQAKTMREQIKNMTPDAAVNYLVSFSAKQADPQFDTYSDEQKAQIIKNGTLKLIQEFNPNLNISELNDKQKDILLKQYKFRLKSACYALQQGKIEKLVDFEALSGVVKKDIEFQYATQLKEQTPDTYNESFLAKKTYEQGIFERNVAEQFGLSLDELRNSKDKLKIFNDYLSQKPQNEYTKYEQKLQDTLDQLKKVLGENFENINIYKENSLTVSALYKYANGEDVDWNAPDQKAFLIQSIKNDLSTCKTPEEKQAKLVEIIGSASSPDEALILAEAISNIERSSTINFEDIKKACEEAGCSFHAFACHSHEMSENGQRCTALHVAENATCKNPTFTAEQAANYTKNMIPQYAKNVQADAMTTMTNTGLSEITEIAGETYSQMDQQAAKEAYANAMQSKALTEEQKQIIARDAIDSANDPDTKDFYKTLAAQNNIDYASAPSKSDRTQNKTTSNTKEETTNTSAKIDGSSTYTQNDYNNIIDKTLNNKQNPITTIVDAANEAWNTLLGRTSDPNYTNFGKITSVDSAIAELKGGKSFSKVFEQSSPSVRKDIIKGILKTPLKKEAIKYLLEKDVLLVELMNYAPTSNDKEFILTCAKDKALSNASVREQLRATKDRFEIKKS